jgi:hypothetical protein
MHLVLANAPCVFSCNCFLGVNKLLLLFYFFFFKLTIESVVLDPIYLLYVNGVYSLIHIILLFFIWSGNHKFYI